MQNTQHPMTDLQGKVALITGASSGIGEAIAEELVKRGTHVALNARREDRLQELEQRLSAHGKGEVLSVPGDVSKPEDVQQLVNQAVQRWGKLDIVIANAGFGYRAPVVEGDIERWKNLLDTNVYGLLLTLKYGVQKLLENRSGHVIVTSSVAGRHVTAGGAVYSGSKFAVNASFARRSDNKAYASPRSNPEQLSLSSLRPQVIRHRLLKLSNKWSRYKPAILHVSLSRLWNNQRMSISRS